VSPSFPKDYIVLYPLTRPSGGAAAPDEAKDAIGADVAAENEMSSIVRCGAPQKLMQSEIAVVFSRTSPMTAVLHEVVEEAKNFHPDNHFLHRIVDKPPDVSLVSRKLEHFRKGAARRWQFVFWRQQHQRGGNTLREQIDSQIYRSGPQENVVDYGRSVLPREMEFNCDGWIPQ
jgi:hypothetical protein